MLTAVTTFSPQTQGLQLSRKVVGVEKVDAENNIKNRDDETTESAASKISIKAFSELNQQEQIEVQQLKRRDQEVKAHEQAHSSTAGALAQGGVHFTYTRGPNGVRYATGGEVGIDTSAVEGDPLATIRKSETIRRAALAPANPSQQDRLVASQASVLAQEARIELSQEQQLQKEEKIDNKEKTEEDSELKNKLAIESNTPLPGSLLDIAV